MGTPNGKNHKPEDEKACDFISYPPKEKNITEYTCVFKQSYARQGQLNADIQDDNRPQHWSSLSADFGDEICKAHEKRVTSYSVPGNNPYVEIQKTCVGHKLKTGDLRNQEFTSVKKKRVVTLDAIKQIVNVLKYQIAERAKSPKYKYCYSDDYAKGSLLPQFSNSTKDNDNVIGEKISYEKCIYKILDCIRKLQRSDVKYTEYKSFQCADSYPLQIPPLDGGVRINETTGEATALLTVNAVTINLNKYNENKNVLSSYQQACSEYSSLDYTGPTTRKAATPTVSKSNIDLVIQTIKNDLNDCICYGDCNGYSVCFCYGNCNNY